MTSVPRRTVGFHPLIWLSGARPEILAQCPTERGKYQGIGAAVLITAGMAAVSMAFALSMAIKAPLVVALVFALLWGLAIMMLDRWLVTTIQRQEHKRHAFYLAAPRLLFALLIGIVISTPLVLQIFKPEINVQLEQMKAEAANSNAQNAEAGKLGQRIAKLDAEAKRLEGIISNNGDTGTDQNADRTLAGLRKQEGDALKRVNAARKKLGCELSGQGGQCTAGDGPLARLSKQELDDAEGQLKNIRDQIAARQAQLQREGSTSRQQNLATAKQRLPQARKELAAAQQQRDRLDEGFADSNATSDGLLLRIKALNELTEQQSTLMWAHLLLLLLFTSIECLPIFVKLLLTLMPKKNLYEEILEVEEHRQLRVAEERARREQNAQILDAEDIITQARLLREARDAVIPRMVEQTVRAEEEIAQAVLHEWRNRELRNIPGNVDNYLRSDHFPRVDPHPGQPQGGGVQPGAPIPGHPGQPGPAPVPSVPPRPGPGRGPLPPSAPPPSGPPASAPPAPAPAPAPAPPNGVPSNRHGPWQGPPPGSFS
ncbi:MULTISPECIES: DUF4407 domain-containing protein [Actinomadura]|uniref:DUF4407 domain-containing protein n=1 Tax=Actinomadura litoris TaxID=2678616 RepID=A0A7K1KT34_9ACTN|nr:MULTISPECIES: DUF4407 domain-containing protein [Actinomadura]MBT2207797.1 DUF4407 domain-containing protein [Actinomadura sp. NEAU-AAG7]MUN35348.1 DUF4407 domain-containing protein [Actinomadura litoris]